MANLEKKTCFHGDLLSHHRLVCEALQREDAEGILLFVKLEAVPNERLEINLTCMTLKLSPRTKPPCVRASAAAIFRDGEISCN